MKEGPQILSGKQDCHYFSRWFTDPKKERQHIVARLIKEYGGVS